MMWILKLITLSQELVITYLCQGCNNREEQLDGVSHPRCNLCFD